MMEMKLLVPWDTSCPEHDTEVVERLKDRQDFESDLEWKVYQAKVFYEIFGKCSHAAKILEEALIENPSSPEVYFCLAECYSRTQDQERARKLCEKGLELDASSDYGWTIKARVELALEKVIDCYISAMTALKINSRNFEAGIYLGVTGFAIAESENNLDEMRCSIENLETTLSLNPDSAALKEIISRDKRTLEEYWRAK